MQEIKQSVDNMLLENNLCKIEQRVISTFLFNPVLLETYAIDEKIFLFTIHQEIFGSICKWYEKDKEVDILKVALDFEKDPSKIEYLSKINDSMQHRANIENDIKYLDNQFRIRSGQDIFNDKQENDFDSLVEQVNSIPSYYRNMSTGCLEDADKIVDLVTSEENRLQFKKLDFLNSYDITPNTLNVIASRTGKGKTALSLNVLLDLSTQYQCLYFNLENPKKVVYQRMVSILGGLTKKQIKLQENKERVSDIAYHLKNTLKIKLYDSTDVTTIEDIRRIILHETKYNFCIVFIDNVNNLKTMRRFNSIREYINYYSKTLLNLKASRNCTIFELCQLKRIENESKRPTLNDLKECGSLEEDADNVFFLHDKSNDFSLNAEYLIYTPKARNESNQETELIFMKGYQKFRERR